MMACTTPLSVSWLLAAFIFVSSLFSLALLRVSRSPFSRAMLAFTHNTQ
jgi:hypothetical protein